MALTPATDPSWPANAFKLESVSVSLSGADTGTYTDTLYLAPANSAATTYTATYTFRVTGTTSTPTPVSPIGYISSGAQIKHTVQSSIAGLAPVPPASNTVTLAISVNPASSTSGGTPTYTLTVNNAGSSDVSLEDFVDTLPSTPATARRNEHFE
jgi:uncharacterized repeat protein (TIGR01451 family)